MLAKQDIQGHWWEDIGIESLLAIETNRKLDDINSKNSMKRGHAERAAINTPIQGGAADIVMMAMIKIERDKRLKDLGFKMLLQIHDGIMIE